ncbi:MAG: WYL domain-containing protein, partial [Dehalococcoidia bacterium]|nr:WYL domain-containing protein [Dehalococcoidia bacterium]
NELPPVQFGVVEAAALLELAATYLRGAAPHDTLLRAAYAKLAAVLPPSLADSFSPVPRESSGLASPTALLVVDRLVQAIATYRSVTLRVDAAVVEADPYALMGSTVDQTPYVVAFDHGARVVRGIALESITEVVIGDRFTPPAEAVRRQPTLGASGYPIVRLRFDANAADAVRGLRVHPMQQIVDCPNGGAELRLESRRVDRIVPWTLRWGSRVEALEPEAFRAEVMATARAMAARYS